MNIKTAKNLLITTLESYELAEPSKRELIAINLATNFIEYFPGPEDPNEDEIISFLLCWLSS